MKIPDFRRTLPALALSVLFAPPLATALTPADLLPLQTGFTVATCYSGGNLGGGVALPPPDPNGLVVVAWNTSPAQLGIAPLNIPGLTYNWQFYHNELALQNPTQGAQHVWNSTNLGEVFGTALDDSVPPNIFVAASRAYGNANWPSSNGPGTVYKLTASGALEGTIQAFPQLPGASGGTPGPGSGNTPDAALGNLCFQRSRSGPAWLYVTNMGDGKIYRMDPVTGAQSGTFDHGTQALPVASYPAQPDNPAFVYTQMVRRPWGIGAYGGRLYYGVFASMDPPPVPLDPNAAGPQAEVWSVGLDATGNFQAGTSVREFKLPPIFPFFWFNSPINTSSLPVSDIEFSLSGAMILAERYHTGCIAPNLNTIAFLTGAHSTRVLEYTGNSGAWVPSPQGKFQVGAATWHNSAGGVGPACDGSVWCSADAIAPFGATAAYGQQRIRGQGNNNPPSLPPDITPVTNSHIIDFDGVGNYYSKSLIGDVDTVIEPPRVRARMVNAVCPETPGSPYVVTLNVVNLMQVPLTQLAFGPCPPAFFPPPGAPVVQSVTPSPALMPVSIAPGAAATVVITMFAPPIGGVRCFSIQGNPSGGGGTLDPFECSPKVCVTLPKCPCMTLDLTKPLCPVYEGEEHTATLTITNLWSTTAFGYQLLLCPINELPAGAITLQPSPFGFQNLAPPLGPGNTTLPITVSFPGLPVVNTPTTVCFSVQLFPQNEGEGPFCEGKVCITFPPCPPLLPCMSAVATNIKCPTAPPGNYSITLTITNQGPVPAAMAVLTPCAPSGGGPGVPANPLPPVINFSPLLTQGNSIATPVQLGGLPMNGVTGCFCVTLYGANGRPFCSQVVCIPFPACPCATFSIGNVQCPQYEGQPYTAVVTVTNAGFNPLYWVGFTPCPQALLPPGAIPGVGISPAGIIPLPPLNPGNTTQIPITLTGIPKTGGLVCFNIAVFGESEAHPECEEKICFNVAPCPPCKPCMNAAATAAVCPTVTGGPFTTNVIITNLQPVPAVTAQLLPCLPGLAPGEVAATPLPGTIVLPPLLQNQSQSYPVSLGGVTSGQLACFCVRLLDANGNVLCEKPVCLVMPQCPALCAHIDAMEIVCPQGGNGYSTFLQIFNQSASAFHFYRTCPVPPGNLPPGAVTGQPSPAGLSPLTPVIPSNGTGGAPVQLPNNVPGTGGTFCFIIKFYGQFDNLICEQLVCLNLPPCQCGTILSHSVDCVQTPAGMVRQLTVTVQNNTNVFGPAFNFDVATIVPGAGFSPAVITPNPNPIPPGGTGTITTSYTGNKPPKCVQIMLTNATRTRCCPLKLCPLWIECATEPLHPDNCELAPSFVSEGGAPAPATAWIYNGSNTPKVYAWTVSPAVVPGCTGTLPPVAFLPSSGVTATVGAYSSLGVPFTISGASLAPGQCAGFQFCFQEIGPAQTPVHCCTSKLKRSRPTDVCVIWDPAGHSIPVGAGLKTIVIKNPASATMQLDLMLVQAGGVEFSLTGEFMTADSSGGGVGMPPPDYDSMLLNLVLGPHESVPVTFTAKVKPDVLPGTGPGPKWTEWQLIRLCNGVPIDVGGGGVDDPHTLASAMVHLPRYQPGPATALETRDYRFVPGGSDGAQWFGLDTDPGEILKPLRSADLQTFLPEWLTPYAAIQGPDGTLSGTGDPLWTYRYHDTARRSFHQMERKH